MITISPVATPAYAPATMPVAAARVTLLRLDADRGQVVLGVQLYTSSGARIPIDAREIPAFGPANAKAFLAYLAGTADTLGVAVQKAALPYLESAYGLTGTIAT